MLSFLLLALVSSVALAQDAALTNVTSAFTAAQIVPDVISSFSPGAVLNVVFTDPVTNLMVNVTPDVTLTLEQVTNQPQFFFILDDAADQAAAANITWIIAIVDPDSTAPETLQFLAADFIFDTSAADGTTLISSSTPLVSYTTPTPSTAADRYVILAYIQPADFDANESSLVFTQSGFNVSSFASSAGIGSPVAGNFFLAGSNGTASSSNSPAGSAASGSSANPTAPAAVAPSPSTASGAEMLTYPVLGSLLSMSFGLFLLA
ncbi:PEBP-like protein [Pluteus cervinus]|uniref:PEBP-like protein n=1 Tax=Pluteus cervinus TaxID=181527 RepID=A0ACD3B2G0_9AGAR|nr:PEBP-like protein [Pluteus cervinus]